MKAFFLVFLWDLIVLDLGFGFLVNNCVYSLLEASENPNVVKQQPKLVLEKFCVKPDQLVKHVRIICSMDFLNREYEGNAHGLFFISFLSPPPPHPRPR